jgi:hypothetical protein
MSRFAIAFAAALLFVVANVRADERKLHVHYDAPAEGEAKPGELSIEANFWLWIPDLGDRPVRGVIVHQHGCGEGAELGGVTAADDLHWQELARRHDCALMGSSYRAQGKSCGTWCYPQGGSDAAFRRALDDFAQQANRPEIATVSWCLWGHSGGGTWASWMMTLHPERIVAVWLRSGTSYKDWNKNDPAAELPAGALTIPVMCNPGMKERGDERFDGAFTGTLKMFEDLRAKGAPIGFAPDPLRSHECGDSRYLAIPFFDACLAMRLPEAGAKDQALRPISDEGVWLGDWEKATAAPQEKYEGDPRKASWLPSEKVAKVWQEYVGAGIVGDETPPPAPSAISIVRNPDQTVIVKWDQRADFESGVGGFDVLLDGKPIASLPEKPSSHFGRPLFQKMSYHDTPEAPLPAMELVLAGDQAPAGASLTIVARNAVGLETKSERIVVPEKR